jgi:hypothetical protein
MEGELSDRLTFAFEGMAFTRSDGTAALTGHIRDRAELDAELNAAGTFLVFAELKDPVRVKLERYELIGPLDPAHFFPTLDAAVDAFRGETGADPTSTMNASG